MSGPDSQTRSARLAAAARTPTFSDGLGVDRAGYEVAIVVPAYNEAATIREIASCALRQARLVVVVDDGSDDDTARALEDLPVALLRNPVNKGKGASLMRGMYYALEDGVAAVITIDGDGQHAPDDIPRLLAMVERYPQHIIVGSRLADKAAFPRGRYYANRVANFWISWAAGYRIEDSQSGFRLYPANLLRQPRIANMNARGFEFESEILIEAARVGCRSIAVPIAAIYRGQARESHFRPVLDIVRIVRMVAWKLISRGLYLSGLYHAFFRRRS